MKTTRLANAFAYILALLFIMMLAGTELGAQNFSNTAAAKINNKGNLIIKGNFVNSSAVADGVKNEGVINFTNGTGTGVFQNDVANPFSTSLVQNIAPNGIIKFSENSTGIVFTGTSPLGATAGERITGFVEYAGAGGDQMVWGTGNTTATFYTNLTLSGTSTMKVADAAHVSEIYTAAGAGARTYTGTFYYDGSAAQTIFGENTTSGGTNRYNNLDFSGGASGTKTIAIGANNDVNAMGYLNTAAATPTVVNNTFFIGQNPGAGASAVDGSFDINGATSAFKNGSSDMTFSSTLDLQNGGATSGTFTMDDAGSVTIGGAGNIQASGGLMTLTGTGTGLLVINGSLTLASNASALLNLDAARRMNVASGGSYVNSFDATGTNVTFNATSIVDFQGAAQVIPATVDANPYGNLYVTSNGNKTTNGDVYFAGNLSVNTGNLTMAASVLHMKDLNKSVIYNDATNTASVDGTSEVTGKFRLDGGVTANWPATELRLNNHNTSVTFASLTGVAGQYFEYDNQKGTSPTGYAPTTDVNRKIYINYTLSAWNAQIKEGYIAGDLDPTFAGPEDKLKFFRTEAGPLTAKLATGGVYGRDPAPVIRWVSLTKIANGATAPDPLNPDGLLASGDELLLRASNLMITVNDGRWSNPNTWDEGTQPGTDDSVLIRHTVHIGFRRTGMDGSTPNGQILETSPAQVVGGRLASGVDIANNAGASLIFGRNNSGGTDEAATQAWFKLGASMFNNNANAEITFTDYSNTDWTTFEANNVKHNGVFMLGSTADKGGMTFITNIFNNNGTVGVGSAATLQVGD